MPIFRGFNIVGVELAEAIGCEGAKEVSNDLFLSVDKFESGSADIVNDPNENCREIDCPDDIVVLIARLATVSQETQRLVDSLPEVVITETLIPAVSEDVSSRSSPTQYKTLVSMREANQNFSKATRMVGDQGSVVAMKNNKPHLVIMNFDELEEKQGASQELFDELLMGLGRKFADQYESAMRELAQ